MPRFLQNPDPWRGRKKKKKSRIFLLLIFIVGLSYIFLEGNYGFLRYLSLKRQEKEIRREILLLKLEHEKLLREKKLIESHDTFYFERRAREELGMIKDGERVIRLVKKNSKKL